jgi:hypothetical protein
MTHFKLGCKRKVPASLELWRGFASITFGAVDQTKEEVKLCIQLINNQTQNKPLICVRQK